MTTSSLSEHHDSNCNVMPPLLSTSGHQLQNVRGGWTPGLENGGSQNHLWLLSFCWLKHKHQIIYQNCLTNVSDILKIHVGDENSPYVLFCIYGQRVVCVLGECLLWLLVLDQGPQKQRAFSQLLGSTLLGPFVADLLSSCSHILLNVKFTNGWLS